MTLTLAIDEKPQAWLDLKGIQMPVPLAWPMHCVGQGRTKRDEKKLSITHGDRTLDKGKSALVSV